MPKIDPKNRSSIAIIILFFHRPLEGLFSSHQLCTVLSLSVLQSTALKCIISSPQKIEAKNSIKRTTAIWKMNRHHLNR